MNAVKRVWAKSALAVVVLLVAGCSSSTSTPATSDATPPPAPVVPVTGKTAFWKMYDSARTWAPDVVVLRLSAKPVTGYKMEGGTAPMWEAVFASPSLHKYRVDSYSIATVLPDIHKGVSAGLELPWGGATTEAQPIDTSTFNIDSDAAYTAAVADAGPFIQAHPDKLLSEVQLGVQSKFHAPVWYFFWGDEKTGGYAVYVDSIAGKVLKLKK